MLNTIFDSVYPLENLQKESGVWHSDGILLNSGRACFNLILQRLKPKHVWIPFYTCNALILPLESGNFSWSFYRIDDKFKPILPEKIGSSDLVVYINYFGIMQHVISELILKYNRQLIVDNTQAFFEKSIPGIISFNTIRKFFGVSDGSYLFGFEESQNSFRRNTHYISDHLKERSLGLDKEAYVKFTENEHLVSIEPLACSSITNESIDSLPYNNAKQCRQKAFAQYEMAFKNRNKLTSVLDGSIAVPFCYPLLLDKPFEKAKLYNKNIFLSTLWPDVLQRSNSEDFKFEYSMANNLLALPVDHRFRTEDISYVIEAVTSCMETV